MHKTQEFQKQYFERHLAALGTSTLQKLHKMSILVVNIKATGAELAKNICLSSPLHLTLTDDSIVTSSDLKFNWFTQQSDIGKHRSKSMAEKLSELNPFVKVDSAPLSHLSEDFIKQYDIVYVTDFYDRHTLEEWNLYCRRNRVGFISACCIGTYCNLFVDLGNLKIYDRTFHGKLKEFYIEDISNENPGKVKISGSSPHFFRDGDFVSIHEVEGMLEVNGSEPRPIRVIDDYTFSIENTSKYGKYDGGGYVAFEKVPFSKRFTSLSKNIMNPVFTGIPPSKLSQMDMHAAMLLYYDWRSELEENPRIIVGKNDDYLGKMAQELFMNNKEMSELHEEHGFIIENVTSLLVKLIKFGDFQFIPIANFIANLGAFQQIVKTGKFYPVDQLIYLNFDEFNNNFLEYLDNSGIKNIENYFDSSERKTEEPIDYRNLR